jgi:hypothetical protein
MNGTPIFYAVVAFIAVICLLKVLMITVAIIASGKYLALFIIAIPLYLLVRYLLWFNSVSVKKWLERFKKK